MSKSKKVDNPDTDEKADEVLANVEDADEIQSEKQTSGSHQLPVSQLVKQNSRYQSSEKVDNSTENKMKINQTVSWDWGQGLTTN